MSFPGRYGVNSKSVAAASALSIPDRSSCRASSSNAYNRDKINIPDTLLGAEDSAEFDELLRSLHEDLLPVGVLEKMLVEKIAVFWWRQRRALQCEAGLVERAFVPIPETDIQFLSRTIGVSSRAPEQEAIKSHLRLPLGEDLDCILRYETTMQRQLVHAINQLERLQRARKGEQIPAPVNVQISNES